MLLYVLFVLIVYGVVVYNEFFSDMIGGFVIIMVMGMLFGDLGLKILILKDIGGLVILLLFVFFVLVFYNVLNFVFMEVVIILMKILNFLYFYIFCLVVGSIFGMNCKVLI